MWTHKQSTGELFAPLTGEVVDIGYSGFEEGKNNPAMQHVRMVGPIPEGFYTIEEPRDTAEHGPYAMPLMPDETNEMFGRSGFLIHGDSVLHLGAASEGCPIHSHAARIRVWASGDHRLRVIP